MAFRFALATVLKIRENIEEREERALQKIQSEIVRVQNQIEELNAQIARAHREREQALLNPLPAAHLQAMLSDAESAGEKRKVLFHNLSLLEQKRLEQVKIYQAAHRDRETLTDMAQRQREVYEQEETRAQQKTLDDIFMSRRHRS
jgi:flagellar FliJ protein